MNQEVDFDCQDILKLDKGIRFVGVCSTDGLLLDYVYHDHINPLLSTEDLKESIQNTIIKNKIRCQESENIGEPVYSVTAYRNVKRATMILDEKLLLLISFERKIDEYQTMQKILNYLKKTVYSKHNSNNRFHYEAV